MSNQLVEKGSALFSSPVPALSTLLQSNINMLNGLITNYSDLDLTEATRNALVTILGGQQPQIAISTAAVFVKVQAQSQGLVISDQDANVIAQAIASGVLNAIQVIVSAPPAAVADSPLLETEGSVTA